MIISFKTTKLQKLCNSEREMKLQLGVDTCKMLKNRLDDLGAAENLEEMRLVPGNCHALTGDRQGEIAISLRGQYRLIFVPDHSPVPRLPEGGLDWSKVSAIQITAVNLDYHK